MSLCHVPASLAPARRARRVDFDKNEGVESTPREAEADEERTLAPEPDFRYVGLAPGPEVGPRFFAGVLAGGAAGAGLLHAFGARLALLAGALAASGMAVSALRRRGPSARRFRARTVKMAVVPWGILVDDEAQPRVLHWAAVRRVHVEMTHGRDGASDSTLWSLLVVDTEHERFAARARGAIPLDRLVAHLDAYARESAHVLALDLDGEHASDAQEEPECESLVSAVRSYVESAPASVRLGLHSAGYRRASMRGASAEALVELRRVLGDRRAHPVDPRGFAAMLAAELTATELASDLVKLVQSPCATLAAVAKVSARRLGVSQARVGTLDEVAPFLHPADVDALAAWGEAAP